jgi:hypothetical protein
MGCTQAFEYATSYTGIACSQKRLAMTSGKLACKDWLKIGKNWFLRMFWMSAENNQLQ